jgi:hypothetical protein
MTGAINNRTSPEKMPMMSKEPLFLTLRNPIDVTSAKGNAIANACGPIFDAVITIGANGPAASNVTAVMTARNTISFTVNA